MKKNKLIMNVFIYITIIMDTYTQILKDILQEKNTDKIIEDYDKNAMENILQENCVKTANEIIKIVIKAINDYANKKETSTGIYVRKTFHHGPEHVQIKFTFSENDSKMLRDLLSNKIPTEIIKKIFIDTITTRANQWHFNVPQLFFLDKILNEQIALFNFKYDNVNSLMNIIEHKYFQLTLYCHYKK